MLRPGFLVRSLTACGFALASLSFAGTASKKTIVTYPSAFAHSQALRDIPIDLSFAPAQEMPEPRSSPLKRRAVFTPSHLDPALQTEALAPLAATKGVDFDGIGNNGWSPSDSNIAVGPSHIVEVVNVQLAAFGKNGALLLGPTNIMNFFTPLGGNCAKTVVDPVVLYDRLADRWVISGIGTGSTYFECVAVSTSGDPGGTYTLYSYSFGSTLNDYPKLGVWPTPTNSAYLATYNLFGTSFKGADLCGLDRTKMLAGNASAAQLCQTTPNSEGSYLPSDNDGPSAPADGTPGLFLTWQNNSPGQLYLRKLTLDFTAGKATMSSPTTISVADDNLICGGGTCVPQLGTSQFLDTLGDRMMYRFPVRHFADHDRAVANHAVANGTQAAVRWYELFDPAGNVTVNQQGTYAPDTTYRWMASGAEDQDGNIAFGYSASSSTINPAIRFTGRVPSDPLGSLEGEISMIEGTGSQTSGLSRWGDYTALQIDPNDDCTFWYVDQYEKTNGTQNWSTHIGSFAFNGCGGGGGGPVVSFNPTTLTWPKVVVGKKAATKKLIVSNTGTAALNITNIAISGDFAFVPVAKNKACGATLAAGASCTIKVSFTPTQTGTRTGAVTFTDDASGSPQSLPLTGTGK